MKKSKTADWDVVIIGAGAAGLAAADVARHNQLSYVLIEASERIGGRAHSDSLFPGCPIDLGCHYLHSASINPFANIARRFGFTLQTHPQIKNYYHHTQPLLPQEQSNYEQYCEQCQKKICRSSTAKA